MPKPTTAPAKIFDSLNLLLPVTCSCGSRERIINLIFLSVSEENSFCEQWGHGSENPDTDGCSSCKYLGELQDPLEFFFVDSEGVADTVFSIRMNLRMIETMTRLIQEYKDDRMSGEKIYLAMDAPCNCINEFGVFRLGRQSDNNDFADHNWDFDKLPFYESNKVIVVSSMGVRFSCDISTKDENRKRLGTVKTRWFSLFDLSEINAWLVARGAGEDRKIVKPKVADDYEDGLCPDCQTEIPKKAKYGDGCANCGHVFNPIAESDDEET